MGGPATGILIRLGESAYLVTAAHVIQGMHDGENIEFRVDDGWEAMPIPRVRRSVGNDIALLGPLDVGPNVGLPQEFIAPYMTVGATASYCGFPLGLEGMSPEGHRWPIPIVKSAIYSGGVQQGESVIHLFDTINNNGFSGGPVFVDDGTQSPKLSAIVSGYRFDRPIPLLRRGDGGQFVEVRDHYIQPNSGFMIAVSIARALELVT